MIPIEKIITLIYKEILLIKSKKIKKMHIFCFKDIILLIYLMEEKIKFLQQNKHKIKLNILINTISLEINFKINNNYRNNKQLIYINNSNNWK